MLCCESDDGGESLQYTVYIPFPGNACDTAGPRGLAGWAKLYEYEHP